TWVRKAAIAAAPSSPRARPSTSRRWSIRIPGASWPRPWAWRTGPGGASPRPERPAPANAFARRTTPHEPRQPRLPDPPADRAALARPGRVQPRQQLQFHDLPGRGADPLVRFSGRGVAERYGGAAAGCGADELPGADYLPRARGGGAVRRPGRHHQRDPGPPQRERGRRDRVCRRPRGDRLDRPRLRPPDGVARRG